MKQGRTFAGVVCLCLFFMFCKNPSLLAQDIDVAPSKLQAALFVKVLAFNKGLASGGDISIHVMGSPEFAIAMKAGIGKRVGVGQGRISAVTVGDSLPTEKPQVIYVGSASMTDKVVEYTRANGIMSITGLPDQVEKGIALGVGIVDGKPRIFVNLPASRAEGIDWSPALLKIATVFR